jgi:hypothetical protein
MSKVVLDVSMSLDGFTAGPNVREAEPMGDGGERLHAWMAGTGPDGQIDPGVRREVDATVGAHGRWTAYVRSRCGTVGRHAMAGYSKLRGHCACQKVVMRQSASSAR